MSDWRILGGPAMMVLGCCFLFFTYRLWVIHPVNRVFRLGPFVTERGMRAVLNLRLTLLSFGSCLVVYGLSSVVYWFFRQRVDDPLVQFLGSLGAGLAIWAAGMGVFSVVRFLRIK